MSEVNFRSVLLPSTVLMAGDEPRRRPADPFVFVCGPNARRSRTPAFLRLFLAVQQKMKSERKAEMDIGWPLVKVGAAGLLVGAVAGSCAEGWRQKPAVSVTNIAYTETTDSHDCHIHLPLPLWRLKWPTGGCWEWGIEKPAGKPASPSGSMRRGRLPKTKRLRLLSALVRPGAVSFYFVEGP